MSFKTLIKRTALQWTLRLVLTAACTAMLAFIFSNSLKTGEQSVQQSSTMVEVVQNVAAVVAPNSAIATATGEMYERLHTWVRVFAHFAEFALFGALLLWCIASYTWKKEWLWLSLIGVFCIPMVDETLQYFVADRGAEFYDVCIDLAGGVCGILFAAAVLLILVCMLEKKQRKRASAHAKKV